MSKKFIDTSDYTYTTLYRKYERFSMPHNQRPYAWKPSHMQELWEAITENEPGYYIGNLVCLEPSEDSENTLIIIDGQQRLTTIILFLVSLRNILEQYKKSLNSNIIQEQINLITDAVFWRDPRTHNQSSRLIPGKENLREVFEKIISEQNLLDNVEYIKELDDNQLRYISNLRYITNILKKDIKGKKDSEIESTIKKVLDIQFIAIVVESENDIYDLFEGLNSTGLGLSIADLLKNAVLKVVPKKTLQSSIESNWGEMEGLFEGTKTALFPRFLRHYWIACQGYVTSSRLFKEVKEIKIKNKSSSDVERFTKELLDGAEIYSGLRFEDFEGKLTIIKKDKNAKRILEAFRYISGLDQVYEVLLAFYLKRKEDQDYKSSNFKKDLNRLLNFTILAKFISINPSDYEQKFSKICEITRRDKNIKYEQEIGKEFKKLFKLVDKKDEFVQNFSSNLKYGSDSRFIEYIISELMRNFSKADRGIYLLDPSIEHILPQSPQKWGMNKEQVKDYVNLIGNLTLLHSEDNNDAGNDDMDYKVDNVYLTSKFSFNRDLKKYRDDFKRNAQEAILRRGKDLAEETFGILKIL